MNKKIHVHFMGIGGSGMAPVAIISKHLGYIVSGCDITTDGYYSEALVKNNIEDFDSVAEFIDLNTKPGDIVIIFGAGESYKLTRKIINQMSKVSLM